ncbi:MAG: hypothetical protein MUO26_14570 [Methanotrichaceae archaeon]|nr:hypothetical protein [Methanotrichaceae archaeon]
MPCEIAKFQAKLNNKRSIKKMRKWLNDVDFARRDLDNGHGHRFDNRTASTSNG